MKDLAILCIAALVLVFALVELKIYTPAVVTLYFGFLTIRKDDATVLYYIKYAVRYFITDQQTYKWKERYGKEKAKKEKPNCGADAYRN